MASTPHGDPQAERWLSASSVLARVRPVEGEGVDAVVRWVQAALGERPELPPVGVVIDLGRLWSGARFEVAGAVEGTERLRAAVGAYEDRVLAPLSLDPRTGLVQDAFAALPAELRPAAVGVLTQALLDRLGFGLGVAVRPAQARRTLGRPREELVAAGRRALRERGERVEQIAAAYEALARGARRCQALVADADVFLAENLAVLEGLGDRLAAQEILEARAALDEVLPRRLKPTSRAGQVAAEVSADAAYPTGGFSSVANAGSIENLVTTELAYMDDDAELDLFDVRFVERELLYYARDESLFVRRQRVVAFVLMPSLAQAQVKDVGLRWQRGVVFWGLVLTVVGRLAQSLNDEGLRVRLSFVGGATARQGARGQKELAQLLLRDDVERGLVEVAELDSLDAARAQLVADSARAQVAAVLVTAGPEASVWEARAGTKLGVLDLSRPVPRLDWSGGPGAPEEPGEPWEGWSEAGRRLLEGLS